MSVLLSAEVSRGSLGSGPSEDGCGVSPAGVGVLGGLLYAAGGHDGPLVRKSVEVFDPQANTWRLVCDMNMCRRNAGERTASGIHGHPLRRVEETHV